MATKQEALDALEIVKAFIEEAADGESAAAETITIPTADEVGELDMEGLTALAGQLSIDIDGKKEKAVKRLLVTLAKVAADEEVEEDELDLLAEALGLTPDAKMSKTLAAVKEWVAALGEAGAESTEEETPAEDETKDEAETPADEETTEEESIPETVPADEETTEENSDSDGVDREDVAAAIKKFPDLKTMIAHLTAFNKVADEEIAFDAKKEPSVKAAYRKLSAELVDSAGEVSAWGVAYARDSAGWSCGLILDDLKIKGEKRDCGKCKVTGKKFAYDESAGEFVVLK